MHGFRNITVPGSFTSDSLRALAAEISSEHSSGLILRGAGADTFCTGMDLAHFSTLSGPALDKGLHLYAEVLLTLRQRAAPSIAVVDGPAVGGGVGLAAACDVCLASARARFSLPEGLYGFAPAVVAEVLKDRMRPGDARLMALRCDAIGADEALRLGLCDRVVAPDTLEKSLRREARTLARSRVGWDAIHAVFPSRTDLAERLDAAVALTGAYLNDPETKTRILRMSDGDAPWRPT